LTDDIIILYILYPHAKEMAMPRTMSKQEHEKFERFIEDKNREASNKEDSIAFLQKVGFCDDTGVVVFPYNSSHKK